MLRFCISEKQSLYDCHTLWILWLDKKILHFKSFSSEFTKLFVSLSSNLRLLMKIHFSRFQNPLGVCSAQKAFRIHFLAEFSYFTKIYPVKLFVISAESPCGNWGVFYCGLCPSVLEIQNIKFWQNATFSSLLFVKYLCWLNIWSPGVVIQISTFLFLLTSIFYSTFLGFQFYLLFCFLLFLVILFSYLG